MQTVDANSCSVLQITDCHLFADTTVIKNGINPYDSLRSVLTQTCEFRTPDILIASGDIAQDPAPATYRVFYDLVRSYYDGPFFTVPGNHDRWDAMREVFEQTPVEINNWCIVPLDTHLEDRIPGQVSQENLLRLQQYLEQLDHYIVVVGHHPCADVGVAWLDAHKVENAEEVLSIFTMNTKVQAYVCGHVHLESQQQIGNLKLWTTPSTCWQFASDMDTFKLASLAPGWRWLDLHPDGTIDTRVERLSHSFTAEPAAL